jgi:ATP-dependent Lon protease
MQSAENAVEAVRGWLWNAARIELNEMHVHLQMRSLSEGVPGQGVSGSNAGLTIFVALVSELANTRCHASKVMTGTIGIKPDVALVGGLGGLGSETRNLVGILKTKRVRITDLCVRRINYEKTRDKMNVPSDQGIIIHPIVSAHDTWKPMFSLSEKVILERICSRQAEESHGGKKGTITNCVPTR